MIRYVLPALVLTAVTSAALAVPGGLIDTLAPASYQCEMPGDASAAAGYRVADEDFTISNSTSYSTPAGRGTYLLLGDRLMLTSGPKQGQKYSRISDSFLRKLEQDGKESPLRCVRRVVNNTNGPGCTAADGTKPADCEGTSLTRP